MKTCVAFALLFVVALAAGCARPSHPPSGLSTISPPRQTPVPLATVGGVQTPPGGIRTISPSHAPGPIFGPSAAPSGLPPPEPSATPYHFATQHLYVAGFNNAAPNKFGHIWRYTLPITDSAQPADVDLRLPNVPNGMAVDNEGNLFVAVAPKMPADTLLEFALPLTATSQKIASGGTTPADAIAIDYKDKLFVTDSMSQTIDVYAHSIFTNTGPAFSMPDPFPGNPVDAAAGPGGEIFVTQFQQQLFGPGAAKLIKYQVPFSVTRVPVVVQDSLDTEAFVGFTRFPQRIYLPLATGTAIVVAAFPYEQMLFFMPNGPGDVQFGRETIDNDDDLYVLASDGAHWFVNVYYRPHGPNSQPAWTVPVPADTATGIAIGP